MIVLTLSSALCAYNLDGLVDPIKATLHLSDGQISFLLGWAFVGTYALASLPGGWIIDHAPRKPVLVVGAILWGVGALTCGLGHSFAALCAGRVLVGLGQATLAPATMSILSDCFPARLRARVLGAALAAAGVGPGVGLTCTGLMLGVAARFGVEPAMAWRVAIIACARGPKPQMLILVTLPWVAKGRLDKTARGRERRHGSGGRFWGAARHHPARRQPPITLSDGAQLYKTTRRRWFGNTPFSCRRRRQGQRAWCSSSAARSSRARVRDRADLLYRRHGVSGRLLVALAAVALLIPLQFLYRTSTAQGRMIPCPHRAGLTVVTGEVVGADGVAGPRAQQPAGIGGVGQFGVFVTWPSASGTTGCGR